MKLKLKIKLKIKPLSVNDAWRGRRFKSQKYKQFEKTVLLMLPNYPKKIRPPKLGIKFMYYFSNASSDIDNPTKPIIDILSKKYLWNDNIIYQIVLEKYVVKQGEDAIGIEFYEVIDDDQKESLQNNGERILFD